MAVSPLLHQSHEVLNADFCSGYIDQFGKWNTGFPCPWLDGSTPGFCCGTEFYKYCCSGKLRIATAPPPPPEDPLLLVLAITLGVAAGITLLILVACFVCPGCLLHKKRRPGPLYRLPCSSTMSTYVPAAMTTSSPGLSNQHHQHQHRPAIGFNDVRTSASFHSFNGGGGGNSGETRNMSAGGGVSSLYSLSDSHCPSPVAMMTPDSNPISNIDQISGVHRQSEMTRPAAGRGGCHHLYWNRPLPRLASSVIGSNNPNSENQLMSVRVPTNSSQGHVQTCRHRDDPSPPPPYEADFNPNMHRHHPSVETMNNRTTSLNQQAQLRQHLQQLQQQHQAETSAFRQQQHSSNISPRQPALCIIDDGLRDNSQLNYHSTKF
ncbi:uncharacterized protein LOC130692555 [Daphnia carinata]|uniref:uncharacterized protein LOC130692555 n=1 Tax=Daphnia carinata TaxID=120202 RepID=UPI00257F335C|nr:uncharacterized protein LOC130692555 [Daphnia carinata]